MGCNSGQARRRQKKAHQQRVRQQKSAGRKRRTLIGRMCTSKRAYKNKREALETIAHRQRRGIDLWCYQCPICGQWHLSSHAHVSRADIDAYERQARALLAALGVGDTTDGEAEDAMKEIAGQFNLCAEARELAKVRHVGDGKADRGSRPHEGDVIKSLVEQGGIPEGSRGVVTAVDIGGEHAGGWDLAVEFFAADGKRLGMAAYAYDEVRRIEQPSSQDVPGAGARNSDSAHLPQGVGRSAYPWPQ